MFNLYFLYFVSVFLSADQFFLFIILVRISRYVYYNFLVYSMCLCILYISIVDCTNRIVRNCFSSRRVIWSMHAIVRHGNDTAVNGTGECLLCRNKWELYRRTVHSLEMQLYTPPYVVIVDKYWQW